MPLRFASHPGWLFAAVLATALPLGALAQPMAGAPAGAASAAGTRPPPARAIASALAVEAAQHAVATCAANGVRAAAVVTDVEGAVRVLVVGDGTSARIGEFAARKAFASVTFKLPTAQIEQLMKTDKAMADRIAAEPGKFFTRAGAQPLMAGNEFVGALAVGGAMDSAQDDVCALAAIAKVQDRLKSPV